MPIESIEREIQVGYLQLSAAAATMRYGHEHYLDGPGGPATRSAS